MRKLSEHPLCFTVTVKELLRYGMYPLAQLVKNPHARMLFSEETMRWAEKELKEDSTSQ